MQDENTLAGASGDRRAQSSATPQTDSIRVITDVEHVRLRPEMYIPPDREAALIDLIEFALATLLEEGAQRIEITLHPDNIVTVSDDGPGLSPQPRGAQEATPWSEQRLTKLRCGFGVQQVVVTNALSEWLELKVWGNGYLWEQSYREGRPQGELRKACATAKHGNSLRFLPDPSIFPGVKYNFAKLVLWFRDRVSNLEHKIAEDASDGFYARSLRAHASYFRKAHFTIIDECPITSSPDEMRRVTVGPGTLEPL